MIRRALAKTLRAALTRYPVVTVTGPRQSGKTTLVRSELPKFAYVSLELPDERSFALTDPRGFLGQFEGPVILDEVQRVPDLFSYLQVRVDERDRPGQFVLTGSQNFLLLQNISQSLAGRCAVLHLLPLAWSELTGRAPLAVGGLGRELPRGRRSPGRGLMETLFAGFYPRIHDRKLSPRDWLGNYYQTYLERDVRNVLNVGDLESFGRFVRLAAGRNAQLLNLSGLAADGGITHTTARRWLSVLEASFIVALLRPYYKNFGKRLIKSPKLFFLDTGLLCYLLGIRSPRDLLHNSARGPVFESFVVSELFKNFLHRGETPDIYYWRDAAGHEVDLIVETPTGLVPVEIKSGETVALDFFSGLNYWREISGQAQAPAALIYGGERAAKRSGAVIYPWFAL